MEESTAELATAIGVRVKQERQLRQWTLDVLANAAGVSRRMLVNIEQGAANPSVGTLLRISDALGVGLPSLVELPRSKPLKVTRSGEGAVLWSGEHGGLGVLVAGAEPPNVVELWDWTLGAGDRHESESHTTGTRELVQVQEGTISISSGEQTVTLNVRDSLSFPGDVAHSYVNAGPNAARFSLAVFEPGVGSAPRTEGTDA
ncbi:MAG TPA: XRE family transcriptional regulator [Microbacteriaceae bacterium]|jgi:transcriptional regulator with XRE-family HTH domain|nr:XRE family transcriptional regulator [Microbacteriaceae bacterium]